MVVRYASLTNATGIVIRHFSELVDLRDEFQIILSDTSKSANTPFPLKKSHAALLLVVISSVLGAFLKPNK